MPLSRDIIDKTLATPRGKRAYTVVERLADAGHEAWWVGGCVREMLQGCVPVDIDITTSAKPEQVRALFKRSTGEGSAFGGARVLQGDDTFEVTTFRLDDEASDGRHPESIVFGTREQDALRRDFTVNAIYWQPVTQQLFDPTHGEDDLRERLVRFIGEPAIRLKHDALRLLRAVRLRAAIDGQYHPDTYAALREHAHLVEILSGARQGGELEKLLKAPRPQRAMEDLWELGILARFLPELHECKGIPQPADYHREGDVWDHTLRCLSAIRPEDTQDVRLAILFHDSGKVKTFSLKERIRFDHHATVSAEIAERALERLQISGDRRRKICWLISHHMSMAFTDLSDERKAHWYFHPWFAELLQVFRLDIDGTDPPEYGLYNAIVADHQHFLDAHPRPHKPLLSGDDVMAILGVSPGEQVGRILHDLHSRQHNGSITTKKEARAYLENLKKS